MSSWETKEGNLGSSCCVVTLEAHESSPCWPLDSVLTVCAQSWKTAASWPPAYLEFSRQDYWSGLSFRTSVYSFLHNIIQIIFSCSYWIFNIFFGKRTIHIPILKFFYLLFSYWAVEIHIFLYILLKSFIRHSL